MPKMKHAAVSPLRVSTRGHPDNSASGSGFKRCSRCSSWERDTRETIHNGLSIIRVRYGIPYCELPDLEVSQLGRYHLFLLEQGKERASVPFPRRQRPGENGLCRLQRLWRAERWELALSVASIKRNLPSGCVHHTPSRRSAWELNAFSQPPPSSSEYLAFVRTIATQVFPAGWDRSYYRFVNDHLPNPSAREPKRSRADHLWSGRRDEFRTLTTSETDLPPVLGARYKEVNSAGKCRPLLIYDETVELLAPLHKTMYNHLCKFDWLLCGPPTAEKMSAVCVNAFQTSVDLVAATDGLCHDVAEVLLDSCFFSSLKIPRSLRALAKSSLGPYVDMGSGTRRKVTHGQQQGSYLSFPLLCLQSYCAARWAARFDKGARFLVNGDDSVISAERGIGVQDYPPGFRLNDEKSIRASNVVEVNSTVFLKSGCRWLEVRHLRRGGSTTSYQGMLHMAKAVSTRPCWTNAFIRARIGRRWGFLPSQIGLMTYPSFRRERGMRARRFYTVLPEPPSDEAKYLRRIVGRDASVVEKEKLLGFLWVNGRLGGLKRDEWSPSPGFIRRSYGYRSGRCWSSLTFDGWRASVKGTDKQPAYYLPLDDFTDEEEVGLFMLDFWRNAVSSLVEE
jgi:hypothetical protein